MPSLVTYTTTNNSNWSDGSLNAYNITKTLRFTASYDCTTEGTTCHIDASQGTANMTVDYRVKILGFETGGSQLLAQVPTIVGDSSDIPVPPPPGLPIIKISIHGQMIGEPMPDAGMANPKTLVWTSWGTRNTNVTADSTVLMLNTTYSYYLTITVIGLITLNTTDDAVQGTPMPSFPVPEFPTALTLSIALGLVSILLVVFPKTRSGARAATRALPNPTETATER